MPKYEIETKRTLMRRFFIEDAESFYQLNADSEVMRYTAEEPFKSVEEAEAYLRSYDDYEKFGIGRFTVIHKDTGSFIGWAGIRYLPDWNDYDMGIRLMRDYWGDAYAVEISTACFRYGFECLGLENIEVRMMKDNLRMVGCVKKMGLRYVRDFDFWGRHGVVFEARPEMFE